MSELKLRPPRRRNPRPTHDGGVWVTHGVARRDEVTGMGRSGAAALRGGEETSRTWRGDSG